MLNVIGLLRGLTSITPRFPAQKLDSLTNTKTWADAKSPSKPSLKVQTASVPLPRRGQAASPACRRRPREPANEPRLRDKITSKREMSQPVVNALPSPPDSQCWRDGLSSLFPAADKRYLIALVTLALGSRSAHRSLLVNVCLRSIFQLRAKAR